MPSMKAVRFEAYGPPSVLSFGEMAMPQPLAGEALIEVRASAVNPSDVGNVAGAFGASLPRVPGRDFAGRVVAGEGWEGKDVWGSGAGFGVVRDGAHAQYVVLPIDWLSLKPPQLSMAEAAAVGVPYLAAWSALIVAADLQAGERVLVTGAAGAVGRAAVEIAHWKGATVIGADRSSGPSAADHSINTAEKDLPAEVLALTEGKGADLILDAVGGALFEPCLKSLSRGGRQVAITSVGRRRVEFDLIDFYHELHRLIGVDTMKLTGPEITKTMNELGKGFEGGRLRPPAVAVWPLERAVEAYETVTRGGAPAKQILLP